VDPANRYCRSATAAPMAMVKRANSCGLQYVRPVDC